jgi:hypothetical protein
MTRYEFKLVLVIIDLRDFFVLFYRPSMEMKRNLVEVNYSSPPRFPTPVNPIIRENYT